jgi:Ca2+/Na+ antiporter
MTDSLSCFMAGIMNIIARMMIEMTFGFFGGVEIYSRILVYCYIIWLFYMTSVEKKTEDLHSVHG